MSFPCTHGHLGIHPDIYSRSKRHTFAAVWAETSLPAFRGGVLRVCRIEDFFQLRRFTRQRDFTRRRHFRSFCRHGSLVHPRTHRDSRLSEGENSLRSVSRGRESKAERHRSIQARLSSFWPHLLPYDAKEIVLIRGFQSRFTFMQIGHFTPRTRIGKCLHSTSNLPSVFLGRLLRNLDTTNFLNKNRLSLPMNSYPALTAHFSFPFPPISGVDPIDVSKGLLLEWHSGRGRGSLFFHPWNLLS